MYKLLFYEHAYPLYNITILDSSEFQEFHPTLTSIDVHYQISIKSFYSTTFHLLIPHLSVSPQLRPLQKKREFWNVNNFCPLGIRTCSLGMSGLLLCRTPAAQGESPLRGIRMFLEWLGCPMWGGSLIHLLPVLGDKGNKCQRWCKGWNRNCMWEKNSSLCYFFTNGVFNYFPSCAFHLVKA